MASCIPILWFVFYNMLIVPEKTSNVIQSSSLEPETSHRACSDLYPSPRRHKKSKKCPSQLRLKEVRRRIWASSCSDSSCRGGASELRRFSVLFPMTQSSRNGRFVGTERNFQIHVVDARRRIDLERIYMLCRKHKSLSFGWFPPRSPQRITLSCWRAHSDRGLRISASLAPTLRLLKSSRGPAESSWAWFSILTVMMLSGVAQPCSSKAGVSKPTIFYSPY